MQTQLALGLAPLDAVRKVDEQRRDNSHALNAIIDSAGRATVTARSRYAHYEQGKRQIQFLNLSNDAYEEAIRRLAQALGI